MLKDLLSSEQIPDWKPDIKPSLTTYSEEPKLVFDIHSTENVTPVVEPIFPEAAETSVIEAANQLLNNSTTLSYDKSLLTNPLTSGPTITLMILGEVKRQKDQVETTKNSLSKFSKKNLLSTFRLTQVLTLESVLQEANQYLTKLDVNKEKAKKEKVIADTAAQELLSSGYLTLALNLPSIPREYFTEQSLTIAAKTELLADKHSKLFSKYSNSLPPAQLEIAYLGFEKSLKQSIEALTELNNFAAQDRLDTLTRLKHLNRLNDCINMIKDPFKKDWEDYARF